MSSQHFGELLTVAAENRNRLVFGLIDSQLVYLEAAQVVDNRPYVVPCMLLQLCANNIVLMISTANKTVLKKLPHFLRRYTSLVLIISIII